MGALTTKTFAYKGRKWELRSLESYDLNDSFFINIQFEFRDSDRILRIIPSSINPTWITDKVRFFFDGFYYERFLYPVFFLLGKEIKFFWLDFFKFFQYFFLKKILKKYFLNFFFKKKMNFFFKKNEIRAFISLGNLSSYLSIFNFYNLVLNLNFTFFKNLKKNKTDFREDFLLDSSLLNSFKNYDLFFLIGLNLRLEFPYFNLIFQKLNKSKEVYEFSSFSNNYSISQSQFNFGPLMQNFINFIEGKHIASLILKKKKNPIFFLGFSVIKFLDFFQNLRYFIFQKYFLISLWSNSPSISELSLFSQKNNFISNFSDLLYSFDSFEKVTSERINIYQGFYKNDLKIDIGIPLLLPYEQPFISFNLFGFLKRFTEHLTFSSIFLLKDSFFFDLLKFWLKIEWGVYYSFLSIIKLYNYNYFFDLKFIFWLSFLKVKGENQIKIFTDLIFSKLLIKKTFFFIRIFLYIYSESIDLFFFSNSITRHSANLQIANSRLNAKLKYKFFLN
jgi:hypothetical protein